MVRMIAIGVIALASGMSTNIATASNQLTLVDANPWDTSARGFFEVDTNFGSHPGNGLYGAAPGNFLTFCLEYNETASEGTTYHVEIGTAAEAGGLGGGNPDPLDARTAFLYTKFVDGSLDDDFNAWAGGVTSFTYLEKASGASLQEAIWRIEDETGADMPGGNNLLRDMLLAYADEAVDVGGEWFGKGLGLVRVMNLTTFRGENAQDMLTIVPLPMPVALGMAGLLGVGIFTRRRQQAETIATA